MVTEEEMEEGMVMEYWWDKWRPLWRLLHNHSPL
jgi:hypothetical protein